MSEYFHVEKPFLEQLRAAGWISIDQGQGFIPSDPAKSLRTTFREWLLPEIFRNTVRSINITDDGTQWLTDRQLDDLRDQILRQPNRTLLAVNFFNKSPPNPFDRGTFDGARNQRDISDSGTMSLK